MPTGYTHNIPDGISTRQFMLQCVRAMGIMVTFRDDPQAAVPKKFEPSTHYKDSIVEAENELRHLQAVTPAEAEAACKADNERALTSWQESQAKMRATKAAYEKMLASVEAWTPPTPDHENYKKFMLDQITRSIDFDYCERDAPVPETPEKWLSDRLEFAERDLAYAQEHWEKELENTKESNDWLDAFWKSLPPEPPTEGEEAA